MVNAKELENEVKKNAPDTEECKDTKEKAEDVEDKKVDASETKETKKESEATPKESTEKEDAEEDIEEKDKKKKEKKVEKKDKKDEKIEELNDRIMRNMAEFDNFRKRSEREKAQMFEMGVKDIVEKILPVVDSFERGLMTVSEENKEDAFVAGMEKIYKQFKKTLEDAGITEMDAEGKPFDPNFHNAVMHVEDENYGENVVVQVLQKGYMYRDTVVRYAMVKVAN